MISFHAKAKTPWVLGGACVHPKSILYDLHETKPRVYHTSQSVIAAHALCLLLMDQTFCFAWGHSLCVFGYMDGVCYYDI